MADEISNYAKDLAAQNAPWSEGVSWWVVLIQGLILLGLGLFILLAPDTANKTVVQLLAVFLLVSGLLDAFQGIDGRVTPRAMPYHMLSAGSAITVGIIVLLDMWQDFMSVQGDAVVISIGLLLFGIMGLIIWILGGERGDRGFLNLVLPIGALALGGVALYSRLEMGATVVRWLGIIAVLLGVLLLVQTFVLYGKQNAKDETVAQVNKVAADVTKQVDVAASSATKTAGDAAKKIDSTPD